MEDFIAYYNGEYILSSKVLVSVNNPGFTRGYGAYECFRTYNRVPFHFDDHIERLKNTCEKLLIPFPEVNFLELTNNLIEKNPGEDVIFRIYVTDSSVKDKSELIILCNSRESFQKTHPSGILKLKTVLDTRDSIGIKSTSYGKAMVEIKRAKSEGFDDVLFVGDDKIIHEASRANLFVIKDKTLYTPKSHLLPGITRATVIDIAEDYGYSVVEDNIHLDFLKEAEEVFVTATIRGITKIQQIDDIKFSNFKQTEILQEYFTNLSASSALI